MTKKSYDELPEIVRMGMHREAWEAYTPGAADNALVPSIRDKKGGLDLFSKMLEQRVIRLDGQVDDGMAAIFQATLMVLTDDSNPEKDKPIQVIINSPGGSVTAGLAMYDAMRSVDAPIETVVSGLAASMGSILLCAGDKRYTTPSSWVMIHQPSGGSRGTNTDRKTMQDWGDNLWDRLTDIYVGHSGVPHEIWDELLTQAEQAGVWLNAENSKKLGLVDGTVRHKKPMPFADVVRRGYNDKGERVSPREHFNERVVPGALERAEQARKQQLTKANDDTPQSDKKPAPKKSEGPK